MGDKGGKKDKEKGQKQNIEKQKQKSKNKIDKQPKRPPNRQPDEIFDSPNIVTLLRHNGNMQRTDTGELGRWSLNERRRNDVKQS